MKLSILIEGHCTIGIHEVIKKYGYTEQRYYQLLVKYQEGGAKALIDRKSGSDKQPVRNQNIVNQIIRLRFLNPLSGVEVIAQKLKQIGHEVSKRNVRTPYSDADSY